MTFYKGVTTIPLTPIKGIALMGNLFLFFHAKENWRKEHRFIVC
jgi:hypothetical protein